MKLKTGLIIGLIITLHLNVFARSYNSARVTDFFHFVRSKYNFHMVDKFDFFAENPEWSGQLINLADSLIRHEFKVKEVRFDMEAVTFREVDAYAYGNMLTPPPVERFDEVSRTGGELYIAIFSTLTFGGTTSINGNDVDSQNLLLKILVENKDGKKIYKKKIRLPYYLQEANYLSQSGIHSRDFEMIYEEALTAALQGGKRFKKRPLKYRPLLFYAPFTDSCNYFSIRETDQLAGGTGNFEIFDSHNKNVAIVMVSGGSIKREFTERFLDLNLTSRLKQTGTLKNSMENQFYDFIAGLAINEHAEYDLPVDRVIVLFKVQENDKGVFMLHNPDLITGNWGSLNLRLEYKEPVDVHEVFLEDRMVGLIQEGKSLREDRKWRHYTNVFFLNSLTEQEQTALVNLFMAYQLAYDVEMEAISEASEE